MTLATAQLCLGMILGQQTFTRKYTMQMSSVSGTMCMYEEHIKRKIAQIRKLKVLQQRIEKTKTSSATNEIQSGGTKVLDQTTSKHTSSDVGSTQNGRTDIDAKGSSNSSCVSTYVEEPFPRESQKRRHSSADIDMDTNSEVEEELSLRKSFRVGS